MTRVAEEADPMDLSEAPITGGHAARELPARAGAACDIQSHLYSFSPRPRRRRGASTPASSAP